MAEFTTTSGQTIARELLIAYLNTGTSSVPVWSPLGTRVEDSEAEYDWSDETVQDILGSTYTTLKKPTITQTFDSYPLDAGDTALTYLWGLAVKDQDAQALSAQDMLIVHYYADSNFAERYTACSVVPTSLGGEGGGNIETSIDVTYGGTRTTGTVTLSGTTPTFTEG